MSDIELTLIKIIFGAVKNILFDENLNANAKVVAMMEIFNKYGDWFNI